MESGRVLLDDRADEVLNNPEMADLYFGGSVDGGSAPRAVRAGVSGAAGRPPPASGSGSSRASTAARCATSRRYVSTFLQLRSRRASSRAAVATEDVGELADASAWALAAFALAGLVHFFVGWTLLNFSQSGSARRARSPLLTTSPLFGLAVAASSSASSRAAAALAAIALMVAGAYLVSDPGGGQRARRATRGSRLGVARCCLGAQPGAHRRGLDGLDSPLLGVTLGMLAAALAYGAAARRLAAPRSAARSARATRWR